MLVLYCIALHLRLVCFVVIQFNHIIKTATTQELE